MFQIVNRTHLQRLQRQHLYFGSSKASKLSTSMFHFVNRTHLFIRSPPRQNLCNDCTVSRLPERHRTSQVLVQHLQASDFRQLLQLDRFEDSRLTKAE